MTDLTVIHESLRPIAPRFLEIVPDRTVLIKEANFAMQALNKNSYLNSATLASKQQAVLNVAQCGLTLNPVLKQAYLVPRYNSQTNQVECYLEPSYQGLVKLITDTGSATHVEAKIVYEGDTIEIIEGSETHVKHIRRYTSTEMKLVYAIAHLANGQKMVEVMTAEEIMQIRERSESYKAYLNKKISTCVWLTDVGEMSRKTVIRRLTKYIPKSGQWEKVANAVELDNSDYRASTEQIHYIESLLHNANIGPEESRALWSELEFMNSDRAGEVIAYLKENQVDPIAAGHNYNMGDIKAKLESEIIDDETVDNGPFSNAKDFQP
jgi:recombination protein RecT